MIKLLKNMKLFYLFLKISIECEKRKIGLITGGIGHTAAFKFLKDSGYKVVVFDDDPNCYLKKKFINIKIEKINNVKNYDKLFFGHLAMI